MHGLKQWLGLCSRANVISQSVICCFRWKEENYRFKKIQLITKKGSRYLLESNLLLTSSSQDNRSGEINRLNFDSSPQLILATDNAETKAMKSPALWQRRSLLHTHLFNQTLMGGQEVRGGERTQVKLSANASLDFLGKSIALKPLQSWIEVIIKQMHWAGTAGEQLNKY